MLASSRMKRSFRGRSGGSKTTRKQKEIRNARGLSEVLGSRSTSNPGAARELDDFLSAKRRHRNEPAPAFPQRGRPATVEPSADEDEGPESRATRDNPGQSQTYYMWTAEGPKREIPSGTAAGFGVPSNWDRPATKGPTGKSTQSTDRSSDRQNESTRKETWKESNKETIDKIENNEFEKEETVRPAVHVRSPDVRKLIRPAERLQSERAQARTRGESRSAQVEPPEKFDYLEEDVAEVISGNGKGKGKNKKKQKQKQAKNQQEAARERGAVKAPVFFDKPEPRADAKARRVRAATEARFVEGIVKRHPDGFGFVISDVRGTPDVYVPRQYMTGIMSNDRVRVEVYSSTHADRLFGEIKEVLQRAYRRVVGSYLPVDLKYGVILGEGKGWGCDLRIASKDSKGAKEGDLVAVEIDSYPGDDTEFTGRVIEIIGDIEEPLNDVRRIIFAHHIPHEFSSEALKDARRFAKQVPEKDIKGRADLRSKPLITIDGTTAKDFDDAVYVEQGDDGFKLWVAIADVSHYVKPDTKLDAEAFERGTSTYFPNHVVPMLPEELSNELCSLKPGVDRLCFVCEMDIDFQGHISTYEFYEAVMKSQARVTYGEAQEVIDGRTPPRLRHVVENIRNSANLAKVLMAKRFREGSLDLEIPETQVVVDEAGESTDIIKSERLFAHRLIEELMLAANICTARFFSDRNVPGIYRIHEEPFDENIQALSRFLHNFGGPRSISGGKLQKKITRALAAFEGRPEAQILNILTLRSMQQAKYSQANLGHFGLSFSHYSHFTSPIRRYPDLIAHRQIKSVLYPAYRKYLLNEEEIGSATAMLSACEQRSVKAERQLISIKKARFVGRFVGQEFDGVISGVTKFGVFVLLRAYDVDGLVKVEELGDDRFIFDDENLRLVGKRTRMSYGIGDPVRIQIVAADAEAGRVEFRLAGDARNAPVTDAKKNRQDVQKRGKTENNRRRVRKERVSKRRRKT